MSALSNKVLFLGVDIGTTNIKAALFDERGFLVSEKTRLHPAVRPYGWDGLDPAGTFGIVKALIKETVQDRGREVRGVAFTSMAETVIPVGGHLPLMEGIRWYETCTVRQYEALCARLPKQRIHALSATYPSWIYSACKMMKVRDDFPDVYRRVKYFMDVSGFMAFMFTGEPGFDATIACRTMLFDIGRGEWSNELIEAAGLDASLMPPLKYPGEAWGNGLTRALAEELGLSEGIAVSTGGQDHIAAAAGAGVFEPSSALISIGTSAAFYSPASRNIFEKSTYLERPFLAAGYSVYKDGGYVLTGMPAGGFCMDWFIHKVLGRDYRWLDRLTLARTDALFLPNLRAMTEDLPAGGFTYLSDRDTGATLFQSIMEALAFECRYTLTEAFLAKGTGDGFGQGEVVMLGGGALNGLLIKVMSHVLSRPLKIHRYAQSAAAFGASLAALLAAGYLGSWHEAAALARFGDTLLPCDDGLSRYLNEKYERHLDVFRAIRTATKTI